MPDHRKPIEQYDHRGKKRANNPPAGLAGVMGRVHIDVPIESIAAFCEKWKICEFALFGSVLREDFNSHSDIDVLVTFSEDAEHSLFDLVHMEDELEALFGRSVDVVSRRVSRPAGTTSVNY